VFGKEGGGGAAQVSAASGDNGGLSGHPVLDGIHVVLLVILQPRRCFPARVAGDL
jgi:hypothetical protein